MLTGHVVLRSPKFLRYCRSVTRIIPCSIPGTGMKMCASPDMRVRRKNLLSFGENPTSATGRSWKLYSFGRDTRYTECHTWWLSCHTLIILWLLCFKGFVDGTCNTWWALLQVFPELLIILTSQDFYLPATRQKIQLFVFLVHYQSFFESTAVTFFQRWTIYFGMSAFNDGSILPFLPPRPVVYFLFPLLLLVHYGPQGRSIGLSGCQKSRCPSGLSQPANHSVSLPLSLKSGEVNSRVGGAGDGEARGGMEKHFPFSHSSQMSILVFCTVRHFPALSNRSASHSSQPMQKINDIIAT